MIPTRTINNILDSQVLRYPFDHMIIDDFFDLDTAFKLDFEFPEFNSNLWYDYNNPLEVKKTMNFWDRFPAATYQAFWEFCSPEFSSVLSKKFGVDLKADIGLNGGGWHIHGTNGKLNIHQDYSIHPKIPMQRKLNIIYHLSRDWDKSWGGSLQLWTHDSKTNQPNVLASTIDVKFNRAVIFDTTQHSWHGFAGQLTCPPGVFRKTLAIYYVQNPDATAEDRYRALYAPSESQKNDPKILKLIEERKKVKR